jgi:prepilin-type N-terminal cleavage/methylation domain-containing protein
MNTTRRPGFTLVEVLVILAILAALAAVLVPTVSNQVRKADVGQANGDLTNLRTGVEAFLVNVHRYPGTVEQLAYPITAADGDINGSTYPSGLVSRWEGPYIDRTLSEGGTLETGFGALIQDTLLVTTESGVNYLTVRLFGLGEPEALDLDDEIDGGDGNAAGRMRWFGTSPAVDSVHFLALPMN